MAKKATHTSKMKARTARKGSHAPKKSRREKQKRPPVSVGVRICQAYYCLLMATALLFGAACPPAAFEYDISLLRVLVLMIGGTVTMWLLSRRAVYARYVGASTALLFIALTLIDMFFCGARSAIAERFGEPISFVLIAIESIGSLFVFAYLAFAPSAKAQLTVEADLKPGPGGHSWDIPLRKRIKHQYFWRDLVIYFVTFSMLGHWLEMLFCKLILAGVFMGDYDPTNAMLWDQWLFPFTAEGAAAVAIVFLLHPAARKILEKTGNRLWLAVILSFLLNFLVCTSIDFATGMAVNQDYSLWDYREIPFNFMGQVCLQNSLVYTIAATLIVWVFYPLLDRWIRRSPEGVVNAVAFGLFGMYLFLAMLHFIDYTAWPWFNVNG